jgi:ribosomal protein S18 acetylase RimI-like enzyme
MKMLEQTIITATENDIEFIKETYNENIASLHGNNRTNEDWRKLISDTAAEYYIVHKEEPVAWFRIDIEDGGFWIGMIQVNPKHQRQGIGKYILLAAEDMAKKRGFKKIGVHTTEDNVASRALYCSFGYKVTEIGPCTTADGVERVGYTFQKEID